jgi:hypothetical protein
MRGSRWLRRDCGSDWRKPPPAGFRPRDSPPTLAVAVALPRRHGGRPLPGPAAMCRRLARGDARREATGSRSLPGDLAPAWARTWSVSSPAARAAESRAARAIDARHDDHTVTSGRMAAAWVCGHVAGRTAEVTTTARLGLISHDHDPQRCRGYISRARGSRSPGGNKGPLELDRRFSPPREHADAQRGSRLRWAGLGAGCTCPN